MNEKSEKKKFIISFTIIALCVVMLFSIVGVTVAWYIDYKKENATLNLGKVELSAQTVYETSMDLSEVIAGSQILSSPLRVSKMSDSVPIYVRAKLAFSINPNQADANSPILEDYLTLLRRDTSFNFYRKAQGSGANTASWSYKYGNYIYLVYSKKDAPNANGANMHGERMFLCSDTTGYILTKGINMPMSLYQDDGRTQFGKSIIFHFAFQAIQGVELNNYSFNSIVSIFDSSFPEPEEQATDYEEQYYDAEVIRKYALSSNLTDTLGNAALTGSTTQFSGGAYLINSKKQTTTISTYQNRNMFSVSFWAKLPSATYTAGADIFSLEVLDKNDDTLNISFETVNTAGTLLDIKGGNIASEGVKQVSTSQTSFVHYVVVGDGSKFKIYVNGELAGFMTYLEEGWKMTGKFTLGDTGMQAHIKDLRIYATTISPYQVANLYNGN